jgi:hypothetical protein
MCRGSGCLKLPLAQLHANVHGTEKNPAALLRAASLEDSVHCESRHAHSVAALELLIEVDHAVGSLEHAKSAEILLGQTARPITRLDDADHAASSEEPLPSASYEYEHESWKEGLDPETTCDSNASSRNPAQESLISSVLQRGLLAPNLSDDPSGSPVGLGLENVSTLALRKVPDICGHAVPVLGSLMARMRTALQAQTIQSGPEK